MLFSSTELPELIGLCDRILVFYRGRLAGELAGSEIDDHSLLHMINTGEVAPGASKGLLLMTDPSPPARRRWRIPEEIGVIAALVVMMVVIGIARPRFLNPINLLTILGNTTFQGMLSLGMVFLLAIREIDLSVGWMFNFSAVIAALMMVAGFNPWLAALAGICFGALLGLVNGVIAVGLRLPTIIVTLGTFSMFQGLSLVVNNGRAIVPADQSSSLLHPDLDQDSASCRSSLWSSCCWPSACIWSCTARASAIASRRWAAIPRRRGSPAFPMPWSGSRPWC